jgi:N-acetylgalactosamine-6-sulfatase
MTGHFPGRNSIHQHFAGVNSNKKRDMPDWLDPDVVQLPKVLKSAGYTTAHFGKWHLGNASDAPSPSAYG